MTEWLVFDLSGIIVTDGLAAAAPQIAKKFKLDSEEIRRFLVGKPAEAYRTGDSDPDIFWASFQSRFGVAQIDLVKKMFLEAYVVVPEALKFLSRIPKSVRLASFSYSPPDRVKYLEDKFSLSKYFERAIYGSDVKASKFAPEAYTKLMQLLDTDAEKLLFVDDRIEFVTAARQAGVETIYFAGFGRLEKELQNRGIELKPSKSPA